MFEDFGMIYRMFFIKKVRGNVEDCGKLENIGFGVVVKGIVINMWTNTRQSTFATRCP